MVHGISAGAQPTIVDSHSPTLPVGCPLSRLGLCSAVGIAQTGLLLSITNAVPGGFVARCVTAVIFDVTYSVTAAIINGFSEDLCEARYPGPRDTCLKTAKWAFSWILSIAAGWALCNAVGMPITFTVAALLPAIKVALHLVHGACLIVAFRLVGEDVRLQVHTVVGYGLDACGPLFSEGSIREFIDRKVERLLICSL